MEDTEKNEPDETSSSDESDNAVLAQTSALYQKWNRLVSINEDDAVLLVIAKVIFRIVGILIFLALSPFILLGLFLGIVAAG